MANLYILTEDVISLPEVRNLLPEVGGHKCPHVSTIWRRNTFHFSDYRKSPVDVRRYSLTPNLETDMAIDVFNEEVVSLSEASKRLPKVRNGKKLHLSTLFRWAQAGKIANDGMRVRLETIQVGGTKCTSLEALQRFFDRLTGEAEVVTPPSATRRDWLRRQQEAVAYLEKELG